jgi:hypothetical protein
MEPDVEPESSSVVVAPPPCLRAIGTEPDVEPEISSTVVAPPNACEAVDCDGATASVVLSCSQVNPTVPPTTKAPATASETQSGMRWCWVVAMVVMIWSFVLGRFFRPPDQEESS